MSFSTAMTESFFRTTIVAHLSSDKATFHAPVRPGDTIGTEVEVLGKESKSPRSGIVHFKDHVTNHDGVLVYTVEKKVLISKRPPAG